ncbi:MAG: hypothetical protein MRJ65_06765 [Candidatus Brocadiaceae bacterium]|nr:hypothetical protein [Candidatus Brocadiaceae bacterium]
MEFLKLFWLTHTKDDLPKVTTQLPVYNERYVIKRLIDAVSIDYLKELHEIQVQFDDSSDETRGIVSELVDGIVPWDST